MGLIWRQKPVTISPVKLLLTSGGITNDTIKNALADLVGKPLDQTSLAFIPTAADVGDHDKSWLIDDMARCKNLGLKLLDIVNIAALPKEQWEPRLQSADILFFSGGNTFHLMYWLDKSGLSKKLPTFLRAKIYVGSSAGSMVAGKNISLSQAKSLYHEDTGRQQDENALGLVDFLFLPHLNSSYFPKVREEILREDTKDIKEQIYALDDNTAVKVDGGKVEVVGEGKYLILNA